MFLGLLNMQVAQYVFFFNLNSSNFLDVITKGKPLIFIFNMLLLIKVT